MYQPPHFREDRIEIQHDLIRAHPLGLLITAGPGGLLANSIPFLIDAEESERGTLRCHIARANPHWREFAAVEQCLVVFQGPQEYISPSWYPTKRETEKVVPTWNLRHRARLGPPARGRRRRLAAPADRRPDPSEGKHAPDAVGGRRCARRLCRVADEGASSASKFRSNGSRASGRSARTGLRWIAPEWSRRCAAAASRPSSWRRWLPSAARTRTRRLVPGVGRDPWAQPMHVRAIDLVMLGRTIALV